MFHLRLITETPVLKFS